MAISKWNSDMHKPLSAIILTTLVAVAAPTVEAQQARAMLTGVDGESKGVVTLNALDSGLTHVSANLGGLTPGLHGFHVHAVGNCDADTGFKSAGGHLAADHKHGFRVKGGPHPGDFPNVRVDEEGRAQIEYVSHLLKMDTSPAGVFDEDGSAVMIHSGPDDYESQPSGAAGDRVACGVIRRIQSEDSLAE